MERKKKKFIKKNKSAPFIAREDSSQVESLAVPMTAHETFIGIGPLFIAKANEANTINTEIRFPPPLPFYQRIKERFCTLFSKRR